MKKSTSILISLLFGIVALFGVAGCNGDTQNELQSKVNDLQSQIEELNDKLADMGEKARERDATIDELNEQIKNRDKRIEDLLKEIGDIMSGEKELGPFYTLQEAYNYGWLTKEDLQTIADYHNNGITYPESLSEDTAESIKSDWAKQTNEGNTNSATDITEEMVAIQKYYGTYHDCVIVIVDRLDANYPGIYAPISIEIGNVVFHYNLSYPQIVVWKS